MKIFRQRRNFYPDLWESITFIFTFSNIGLTVGHWRTVRLPIPSLQDNIYFFLDIATYLWLDFWLQLYFSFEKKSFIHKIYIQKKKLWKNPFIISSGEIFFYVNNFLVNHYLKKAGALQLYIYKKIRWQIFFFHFLFILFLAMMSYYAF